MRRLVVSATIASVSLVASITLLAGSLGITPQDERPQSATRGSPAAGIWRFATRPSGAFTSVLAAAAADAEETGCKEVDHLGYCEGFCPPKQKDPDGTCNSCIFDVSKFAHKQGREWEFSGDAESLVDQSAAFQPYMFRCSGMRQEAKFAVKIEELTVCIEGDAAREASLDYGQVEVHLSDSQSHRITLSKNRPCNHAVSLTYPHAGTVGEPPKVAARERSTGDFHGVAQFNLSVRRCLMLQRDDPNRKVPTSCSLRGGKFTLWTTEMPSN